VDLVRLIHIEAGIHKLRLSGGEPLLYPHVADLTARLRLLLPKATLGITTNGTLLAHKAAALRAAGLDSVNVSLDSLDSDRFREVTAGGSLGSTLHGIQATAEAGFSAIKLNTVLIRRTNGDQLPDLVRYAARLACEIRFIELMPFGHGAALFRSDFLAAQEAFESLKRAFRYLSTAPSTSTAGRHRFLVDGRVVVVGLITPVSQPFCSRCDRLRLSRAGRLYACLRQSSWVDLLTPLRADDEWTVRQRIRDSLCGKQEPGRQWPVEHMVTIGG
jgi:cyclic pyranopterin phosphate synthase